jgi:hypothetical protein
LDQILLLNETLVKFSKSIGLKINFNKFQMLPIIVLDEILNQLALNFGCQVGRMTFTYLGLPLGTTRPTIAELSPMVCRLKRKLTSSSIFFISRSKITAYPAQPWPQCPFTSCVLSNFHLVSPNSLIELLDNACGEINLMNLNNPWQHGILFVCQEIRVG